jgi:hypothetical protein
MKNKQVLGKVVRTFKKEGLACVEGKLCEPEGYFEMLEKCKKCNKIL